MTAKAAYRVLKPYVTLKVADGLGSEITLGYYEGGFIENPVEGEHLDQLVESGYVEKVSASEVPKDDNEDGKASAKSSSK